MTVLPAAAMRLSVIRVPDVAGGAYITSLLRSGVFVQIEVLVTPAPTGTAVSLQVVLNGVQTVLLGVVGPGEVDARIPIPEGVEASAGDVVTVEVTGDERGAAPVEVSGYLRFRKADGGFSMYRLEPRVVADASPVVAHIEGDVEPVALAGPSQTTALIIDGDRAIYVPCTAAVRLHGDTLVIDDAAASPELYPRITEAGGWGLTADPAEGDGIFALGPDGGLRIVPGRVALLAYVKDTLTGY
jgi:hypothetical protein